MMRRLSAPDGEREVLGQLGEQRSPGPRAADVRHRRDRSGLDLGCASAARSVASSASPVGATAFGSVATAPTKARTTISGQRLTKRDSSVEPGDEVRDEPHDRQIGRAERVTVNVDRHRRQCRRHRRRRSGRGERWDGRRQRRRSALRLPPSAARPRAPAPPIRRSRRRTRPRRCLARSSHHRVRGRACSRGRTP